MRSKAIIVLLGLCLSCKSSLEVKDQPTYARARTEIKKGDKKAWNAISRTLHGRQAGASSDIHEIILSDLSNYEDKEAETLLFIFAEDNSENKRGLAIDSLRERHSRAASALKKKKIHKKLYNAIRGNSQKYGTLLAQEIKALGELKNNEAIQLLKQNLGKDEKKDALIIEALGHTLEKELENIENIQETTEVKLLVSEAALLSYLNLSASAASKAKAIAKIYETYSPNAHSRLMHILQFSDHSNSVKFHILNFLVRNHRDENSLARKLRQVYFKLKANIGLKEVIVTAIATLEKRKRTDVLAELRKQPWKKKWKKKSPRKVANTRGIEYRTLLYSLKKLPPHKALEKTLQTQGLDSKVYQQMNENIIFLTNNLSLNTSQRYVFAALKLMHPGANYFDLKKYGQEGLTHQGLFSKIMNLVIRKKNQEREIYVLKTVYGITYSQARKLHALYQKNHRLFRQMKL